MAEGLEDKVEVTAFSRNVEKAAAIRDDGHIGALNGPKVTAFQACMADPHHDNVAVVVDSWMATAAGLDAKDLEHVGVRDLVITAVRRLAVQVRLAPMQVQAIVWLGVREAHGYRRRG